jgi:DNA-binding transcriptional MocR family regulator
MIGFGGFTNEQLTEAVRRLRKVLEEAFQVTSLGCSLVAE